MGKRAYLIFKMQAGGRTAPVWIMTKIPEFQNITLHTEKER